ncbi:AMP_1a_G0039420.mRNA.1.CDS.1 [Saccharomyces cerevisiae]|nr:AMP_1a_G0039420.mRNA.1.CDS.1 [Saccharomyces cerevisiae]CAI6826770.1 AMP_1a_G0039420.mRNA.1.CDS.1 [Saccharomyces cerevisiae]
MLLPRKISGHRFDPKPFGDHDVDVEIEACGICGSDFHIAVGNWGPVPENQILGHEIIGRVVKVGSKCHTGVKSVTVLVLVPKPWRVLSVNVAKVTTSNTVPMTTF